MNVLGVRKSHTSGANRPRRQPQLNKAQTTKHGKPSTLFHRHGHYLAEAHPPSEHYGAASTLVFLPLHWVGPSGHREQPRRMQGVPLTHGWSQSCSEHFSGTLVSSATPHAQGPPASPSQLSPHPPCPPKMLRRPWGKVILAPGQLHFLLPCPAPSFGLAGSPPAP